MYESERSREYSLSTPLGLEDNLALLLISFSLVAPPLIDFAVASSFSEFSKAQIHYFQLPS